jgi:hypothetical protein
LFASSKKQGDWIMLSSCILVTLKFAAGQQVCRPSRAELGLKDWAIEGRGHEVKAQAREKSGGTGLPDFSW